ncbi:hypothetical protein GCM10028791_00410 [Echinicola sediminis]
MKRFLIAGVALLAATTMTSCLQDKETDFEKRVKQDDQALSNFITENGIEATKTTAGYYYTKDVEVEEGAKLNDGDIIGIYYEIETLDGAFIADHTAEDGEPILFEYDVQAQTLAPIAINLAVALANEGETLTLYVPSYRGYGEYGYGQLFGPNTNLIIKVTFEKIYPSQEVAAMEEDRILAYIEQNELEGFSMKDEGVYVRTVEEGDTSSDKSKNGTRVSFTYELFRLGESEAFSKVEGTPISTSLGNDQNFDFINIGLNDLHDGAEVEVIAPSTAGYDQSAQVLPDFIREDYFEKGYISSIVRPFDQVLFKAKVEGIQ